ncbi:MAG: ABC transporter substrate-binding protein, partial [bacterium]|nr:ABC transporter substrate-binding protein [bacterium]
LPLISPASTDASLTQINIPWMFRCPPDDERITRLLANHVFREKGLTRVVAMASVGYDSRLRSEEFEKAAQRFGSPLLLSLFYDHDFSKQLRLIEESGAQALVLFGQPQEVVPVLRGLRERGLEPEIFGGPGLATAAFPELAGELAEGVTVVAPFDLGRDDPVVESFRRRFAEQYDDPPDVVAGYSYDATQLVVAAIRAGGLNRARIRDALAAGEPFAGVSGEIRFDGSGGNVGAPVLKVIRGGRFVR